MQEDVYMTSVGGNSTVDRLRKEYEAERPLYEEFTDKIKKLMRELLKLKKIEVAGVEARTKTVDRVEEKIKRKRAKYKDLSDITDLTGVRIVCYIPTQVDEVAAMVQKNFKVLDKHSIDKRSPNNPSEFGYASLHYVAQIGMDRKKVAEWTKFRPLLFEVQIRTVLQHAWAQIEHGIGYKTEHEIPQQIRRKFSMLSGMLELVDGQFTELQDWVRSYRRRISLQVTKSPSLVRIDRDSLGRFYEKSEVVAGLDSSIAKHFGAKLASPTRNAKDTLEPDIEMLAHHSIDTVESLNKLLIQHNDLVLDFTKKWSHISKESEVRRGTSVVYLCWFLAGSKPPREIKEFIQKFPMAGEEVASEVADQLATTYKAVSRKR